jgi:hypothetical protein
MTKEELENNIKEELSNNRNFPPELPMIKESIGKSNLMYPRTFSSQHNATPLLLQYAKKAVLLIAARIGIKVKYCYC